MNYFFLEECKQFSYLQHTMAAVESDFPRGVNGDKESSNPQNNAPNTACVSNLLFNYAFCSLKMLNISTGVWNDSDILHKIYSTSIIIYIKLAILFFSMLCPATRIHRRKCVSHAHAHAVACDENSNFNAQQTLTSLVHYHTNLIMQRGTTP